MEKSVLPKRAREELEAQLVGNIKDVDDVEECSSKRQKPYNHILSLLESEEEDSTQDLSPLMITLQKEINSASFENDQNTLLMSQSQEENDQHTLKTSNTTHDDALKELLDEEDEKERVMRHLLQASDDELGIPSSGDDGLLDFGDEFGFNGGDGFPSLCDKLWELEDEAANYYALLQSELFLWEQ